MDELMKRLNAEQLEAVTTTEGYMRVIAGAGSGKTGALTARFAYLVNELGVMPGNILCVTFTNKAANEMRRRIHNLTGDNDTAYINTFHGFCVSVLQEDAYAVGYPRSFLVLDNSDIDAMLRIIYEERGLTLRDMTFSSARDMIEIRKGIENPDYYKDLITMSADVLKEKYMNATEKKDIIFYGYLYQEKKCFALDYNDLIFFSLYIFATNDDIRLKWQQRLQYIMIDEFQDIDMPQYRLMEVLCAYHKNLFVVGDPDQTIYTWRGADIRYLLEFADKFVPCRTIMMNRNYRSYNPIISAANSIIEKNETRIPKSLIPDRAGGTAPVCRFSKSAVAEAEWIADRIQQLNHSGIAYKDIAVLYRAHYVTRNIEEAFLKKGVPYTIYSGVQFFSRAEIKDALSYLRMLVYKDDLSFARTVNTPKRNIGERRQAFLRSYADENGCTLYEALRKNEDTELFAGTKAREYIKLVETLSAGSTETPASELLTAVLNRSGYEKMLRTEGAQERLDNLAELKQSVYEYETGCGEEATPEHYLTHVAMFTNSDLEDNRDRVKLMTVHAAKGLEFQNVFLCALNEGVFPSGRTITKEAMEEERRLAFVAVTRARDRLFLSGGEGRNTDGSPRYPSRFLLDIAPELIAFEEELRDELVEDARAYIAARDMRMRPKDNSGFLSPGQKIMHDIFGQGSIISVNADRQSYTIQFEILNTPRELSVKAKLKPVE